MNTDIFEALFSSKFFYAHKNPPTLKSHIHIFACQMELPRFFRLLTRILLYRYEDAITNPCT